MSPIKSLTSVPKAFIRLGRIKKGIKDESGMHDLDYFRMIFDPSVSDLESEFRRVYGEKPTRINIRLAFQSIEDVWDANYECYKKGGLIAKAGENDAGPYWIYYRDPNTSEVLVRDGRPVGHNGETFMQKKIDISAPIYSYRNKKGEDVPVFLEPVGRLNVVIPELANAGGVPRVGFFEFCPGSPRDIRTISAELAAIEFQAKAVGKSISGIPMVLTRREEQVTKNINGALSKGPSWVVHIEVGGEWGSKALEAIRMRALPDPSGSEDEIVGEVSEIETVAHAPSNTGVEKEYEPPFLSSQATTTQKAPAGQPSESHAPGSRPYPPDVFKAKILEIADQIPALYGKTGRPLTKTQREEGIFAKIVNGIFDGDQIARHVTMAWLFGNGSTKDMTAAQIKAVYKVAGIKDTPEAPAQFDSAPNAWSRDELRACYEQAKKELAGKNAPVA